MLHVCQTPRALLSNSMSYKLSYRPIFERNLTAVPKESTLLQNSKMGFQKLLPHYNKYGKELNNIYELPKSPTECQMRVRARENSRPRMKVPEETTGHQGDTLKQQPTLLLNSRAGRNGEPRLPGRGHTHHAAWGPGKIQLPMDGQQGSSKYGPLAVLPRRADCPHK